MSDVVVYLVGAGPGDRGLITVRGAELLGKADVVVYDHLANPSLMDLTKPDTRRLYVGKKGFEAHLAQQDINELLVDEVLKLRGSGGGTIVRLKGGDPFVFGRGGEEALVLRSAGIPFEIVPGVTSGVAAAAYAGVPVTHRGLASTMTFVTGHEDSAKDSSAVDWKALASLVKAGGTICFYMGMRNLSLIVERFLENGAARTTPVAVVQWGTLPQQRSLVSDLDFVTADVAQAGLGAPAIVIVGAVAALRNELSWFERRPLFGKRIVVTRARAQASGLVSRLAGLGADVIEFPAIEIAPPRDSEPLDAALEGLSAYDWLVFTSVNGVDAFFARMKGDARQLAGLRIAAIGPATAHRLSEQGIRADAVPSEYRGEAVFEAMCQVASMSGGTLSDARVLIVRAEQAREALPDLLRQEGAAVDIVAAYRTVMPDETAAEKLASQLRERRVDAVTFTSSSTVRNFMALLGDQAHDALDGVGLFSIGPVTSSTIRRYGLESICEAREYTIDGLVGALVRHFAQEEESS